KKIIKSLENLQISLQPEPSFTENIAVSVSNIEDDVYDYYNDNGTTKLFKQVKISTETSH
ncbi:unnamed protein product, partial [Brachionus calyciflorus]